MLDSFSKTTVTNYHPIRCLKTTAVSSLTVLEAHRSATGVSVSAEALGENCPLPLSISGSSG